MKSGRLTRNPGSTERSEKRMKVEYELGFSYIEERQHADEKRIKSDADMWHRYASIQPWVPGTFEASIFLVQ